MVIFKSRLLSHGGASCFLNMDENKRILNTGQLLAARQRSLCCHKTTYMICVAPLWRNIVYIIVGLWQQTARIALRVTQAILE